MKEPKKPTPGADKKTAKGGQKKPLGAPENPLARDSRGKATRQDVRRVAPHTNAPRSTRRGS
jgi:hypothetical protein